MIERDTRVLLTGAAGGIGLATARELARRGAALALLDRDSARLAEAHAEIEVEAQAFARLDHWPAAPVVSLVGDLGVAADVPGLFADAVEQLGGVDVLVNNAGVLSFTPVELEDAEDLEALFAINVVAPLLLSREAVRHMCPRGSGRVVNVGSIFGSIGFAYFASYSSSKFALRGYSEALRRELSGSGVEVTYVAPRATRTRLATVFGRMAAAVGMKLDEPEVVAARIVRSIEAGDRDRYLGFPESLFVRVNALLPRFVDRAVRKQDEAAREYAVEAAVSAIAGNPPPGSTPGRATSNGEELKCRS